jgi:hypothetical protein
MALRSVLLCGPLCAGQEGTGSRPSAFPAGI